MLRDGSAHKNHHVRLWQILLQKSFWGGEPKFSEPLMRLAPRDVRDHIVSRQNDHGPSYRRHGASPRQRCLGIDFREIFGVVGFSTFATKSAHCGTTDVATECPIIEQKQTSVRADFRCPQDLKAHRRARSACRRCH
jgi:hypothetical protein